MRQRLARPILKSADEIEALRRSNLLSRQIVAEVGRHIGPGQTTHELDQIARRLTIEAGAQPAFYGYQFHQDQVPFPGYICASVNEAVIHGVPNERPLVEGDLVKIDYGCVLDGWFGDTAYTWSVGEPAEEVGRLMEVTKRALALAIEAARPGRRVFDVARAVQQYVEAEGFGVVRRFEGHGIGRHLHEPPAVPNFVTPGLTRQRLRPGMTMCLEPMVTAGSHEVTELDDGWTVVTVDGSLTAHYEHTVALSENGADVLSLPDEL